ncbi:MAG: phosphatidate cytidylyltransferase [Rhizobiales bacterium]|nr:phosphatidate cytidylyltransferase [Hyphomicrobiales bacterium]
MAPDARPSVSGEAKGSSNLFSRVVAALILAPLTIMVVFAGGWIWILLVTAVAIGLFYEWDGIVNAKRDARIIAIGVIALELIGLALWFGWTGIAFTTAIVAPTLIAYLSNERRAWNVGGFFYAAAALIASVLVRLDPAVGFYALVYPLLIVWVTDIGGYFAGRGIGGPKLAPRISPKKTWAGAIGGIVLSLVIALAATWLGWGRLVPMVVIALVLSIVSQFGDLFESRVKRQFGVKDSSQIIPGHGGLLDRLDGFVAAIVFAALFGYLRGGLDGVGRGFMMW